MKSSIKSLNNISNRTAKIVPLQPLAKYTFNRKLIVRSSQEVRFMDLDDILYCQAEGNYTVVHTSDGTKTVASICLKHILEQLGEMNFVRIHQSYVVSKHMLSTLYSTEVELQNGMRLPLSRSYRKRILSALPK